MWVLRSIPSQHRATTVRSKSQMTAERGRKVLRGHKVQRQPSPAKAFCRTLSRIGKLIIIIFGGSYVFNQIASLPRRVGRVVSRRGLMGYTRPVSHNLHCGLLLTVAVLFSGVTA